MIMLLAASGLILSGFLLGWRLAYHKYRVRRLQAESKASELNRRRLEKVNALSKQYQENSRRVRGRTVPIDELNRLLNDNSGNPEKANSS